MANNGSSVFFFTFLPGGVALRDVLARFVLGSPRRPASDGFRRRNTMKRVPEEQVAALRAKVENLSAFQDSRGKWGKPLRAIVAECVATSDNPTQCLAMVEKLCSRLKVVADKASQLKNAGHEKAVEELFDALSCFYKRLPWEATAPCPKIPVTLLMLDPVRTLSLFQWLVLGQPHDLKDHFVGRPTALTTAMFTHFPEMLRINEILEERGEVWGALAEIYRQVLEVKFTQSLVACAKNFQKRMCAYTIGWRQYSSELDFTQMRPCRVFYGVTQKDVLCCFSREDQKKIATWEFNAPDVVFDDHFGSCHFSIGLHPETEHAQWKKEYPDWSSHSVQAKMGATILQDRDEFGSYAISLE